MRTRLTWQSKLDERSFTWDAASAYCANLTLSGGGWRMPSKAELESIVDDTRHDPAANRLAFYEVPNESFWTGSNYTGLRDFAWYVDFASGVTYGNGGKEEPKRVRCVRQARPTLRVEFVSGRDGDRSLTQVGRDKLQRSAAGLAWLQVKPDAIWSSPLLRARQTAEILRDAIAPGLDLAIDPTLRSEADVDATLQALQAVAAEQVPMLVGHEPHISAFASTLLTGSVGGARMPFKPGSMVALEQTLPPTGCGSLRWFMTPEQLGRLGG